MLAAVAAAVGIVAVTIRDWLRHEAEHLTAHASPSELLERLQRLIDTIADHAADEAKSAARLAETQRNTHHSVRELKEQTDAVQNTALNLLKTSDQLLLAINAVKELVTIIKYAIEHPSHSNDRNRT